jgi:hypothetical protein
MILVGVIGIEFVDLQVSLVDVEDREAQGCYL